MMKWTTAFTERFPCSVPIVGAPMLGVSGGLLAAETSRAGGLGFLAAGHLSKSTLPQLEKEIILFRKHAENSPLCIGFIGHSTFGNSEGWTVFEQTLQTHRPGVVQFFAPAIAKNEDGSNVQLAQKYGALVLAQVGSVKDAEIAIEAGVDGLIAQGTEAGGHGLRKEVGNGTLPLSARVVKAAAQKKVPVLAAGGISDGRGFAAAIMLGCDGIVLGTRLWASHEGLGSMEAKEQLVSAKSGDDVVRTSVFDTVWNSYRSVKWPHPYDSCGALRTNLTEKWDTQEAALETELAEKESPKWLEDYKVDSQAVLCGEGVGEIDGIASAYDIVTEINMEAIDILTSVPKNVLK